MIVTTLQLAGGILVLILGADMLVRGASALALRFGIPPLVVGLTVVAFGTSAPELAVSLRAAVGGQVDVALGNVVGSNIFNVLLILGLSALITPLVVARQLVRLDVPLMIGCSSLVLLLALDGRIGRLDGLLLAAGIIVYTAFLIRAGRREGAALEGVRPSRGPVLVHALLVLGGLALLVLGSRWLVAAAIVIGRAIGLSELIIGLTIIAAGTSLPEVASSVVAAVRGERDIAVGNVVGSNIFNLLCVLGFSSLLSPAGVAVSPAALRFDLPVMLAVAVACLPIFFTGHRIDRWEGALFLAYYAAYAVFLVLDAQKHDALPAFSSFMLFFALPITALTLLVLAARAGTRRT